jgi:hypothetical protein
MAKKKAAARRLVKSNLSKVDTHVVQAREYAELPELTP